MVVDMNPLRQLKRMSLLFDELYVTLCCGGCVVLLSCCVVLFSSRLPRILAFNSMKIMKFQNFEIYELSKIRQNFLGTHGGDALRLD